MSGMQRGTTSGWSLIKIKPYDSNNNAIKIDSDIEREEVKHC